MISLRKQIKEVNLKLTTSLNFEKIIGFLNDMLRKQRDFKIKLGLGYDAEQPSSSKAMKKKPMRGKGVDT